MYSLCDVQPRDEYEIAGGEKFKTYLIKLFFREYVNFFCVRALKASCYKFLFLVSALRRVTEHESSILKAFP